MLTEVLIKIDMIGPEAIHKHNCLSAERDFVDQVLLDVMWYRS